MEYVVFASKDLLKNLVSFQRMFRFLIFYRSLA